MNVVANAGKILSAVILSCLVPPFMNALSFMIIFLKPLLLWYFINIKMYVKLKSVVKNILFIIQIKKKIHLFVLMFSCISLFESTQCFRFNLEDTQFII